MRRLFDACINGESAKARQLQFKLAQLWDLFRDQYPSSLKGGMALVGGPWAPPAPLCPPPPRTAGTHCKHLKPWHYGYEPRGWNTKKDTGNQMPSFTQD